MINRNNPSCVALGNFDGIHIGHDILIRRMIELSDYFNQDSIIITFKFTNKDLKKSSNNIKYINSVNTKLDLLKSYNVTSVEEIELNEVVSKYSPEQFIKEILIDKYNTKNIVVGFNFTFGYKASGNINTLREFESKYNYKVEEIKPVKYNGIAVSSTLVRSLIKDGKINEANKLLLQKYTIYNSDIFYNTDKNIGTVNNKSIIIPPDGKYKVLIDDEEITLNIITTENTLLIFDKKLKGNENIIFISKLK
jgi:riboflavin kinase/FMN adenylyltransferase